MRTSPKTDLTFLLRVLATLLALSQPSWAACDRNFIDVRGDGGKVRFEISVADSFATRAQGLMHVPQMARFTGMLFIYPEPIRASFWMKNTLIPLDMLFADKTGRVTRIHENAEPLSEAVIDGGADVLYVLEINGGLARSLGLTEGAELRHPDFDQSFAVWPCD